MKAIPKTLEDIESLPKEILGPADIAPFLGCAPYSINCACKAGTLPWAYLMGTRTYIPKQAFLHYFRYGQITILNNQPSPQMADIP